MTESYRRTNEPRPLEVESSTAGATGDDDHGRCISCGAEIDHYLGCPDDPNPDYEAEAELPERQSADRPMKIILRHKGHDPALICRPVGNGLCEPYIVKVGCEIDLARQGGLNVISAH